MCIRDSLRTDALFEQMQARKEKMAILVDEYGGVSGMVTLEDLIEEIVGDIHEKMCIRDRITRMTSDINQVQNGINMTLRLLLRSPFVVSVSYTHLDVYKRQLLSCRRSWMTVFPLQRDSLQAGG